MKKKLLFFLLLGSGLSSYAQNPNIAFIGQASSYDALITDNDGFVYQDDHAAAIWFMDTFLPAHAPAVTGNYLSFEEVANGANLSLYDLIWVQMDGATYVERLNEWPRGTTEGNGDKHCVLATSGFQWNGQCTPTEDAFMANLRNYYQAGGNILLGNYAGKALEVIGAFDGLSNPWEYRPNQTFGDTAVTEGNTASSWGTNWGAAASHPYISNISLAPSECSNSQGYIEFLTAGTQKKNRACQYNLDFGRIFEDAGGSESSLMERRSLFTSTLNAEILLQNCDGNEIQGAQFNPRNEGDGTIVWYGAGVYDWFAPGSGNNDNVSLLTENTLLSLAQPNLSVPASPESQMGYYPNPVTQTLNLTNASGCQTEIYSLSGTLLTTSRESQINLEQIESGIYLVKVTNQENGRSKMFKIIKSK